jgi:uncharacterized membrane protein YdbT with pleckstrin-like domain
MAEDPPPEDVEATFDWLTLDEGEEVIWTGQPHVYSLVPALIVGIPLSLLLIGIPIVVGAYLGRENTVYLLTNEGLYQKSGILSRDVQKIEFEKVQNTAFSQGPLGNAVGYGNVDISTAGGDSVEMRFRAVPDPKDVQARIKQEIRKTRSGSREDGEGSSRDQDDVLDEILGELRAIRTHLENGAGDVQNEHESPPDRR